MALRHRRTAYRSVIGRCGATALFTYPQTGALLGPISIQERAKDQMIRKLLLASTATALLTGAASAADLPRRAAPPPVFTPVPVFTWTGFYAGFNAGYGFDASSNSAATVVDLPAGCPACSVAARRLAAGQVAFSNSRSNDGFSGGGQIGYNYQFTPGSGFVIGIEADAQYVDFGRNRNRFAFATLRRRRRPRLAGVQPERPREPRLLRHRARPPRLRLGPHPVLRHRRLRLRLGRRPPVRPAQQRQRQLPHRLGRRRRHRVRAARPTAC